MGSLTYEEIFELLRRERNSEDLQTLDPHFYADLVQYFKNKESVLDDTSEEAQIFGASERDRVQIQLENARKITKELLERREKKIIMLALNKARTESDIIDTSALLDVEQEFYHECADLFSDYKEGVLERIVSLELPEFGDAATSERDRTEEESAEQQRETSDEEKVKVRFTSSIPKFVGKNEEVLGPFDTDDTAELSEDIASVLVGKGRAERIEE